MARPALGIGYTCLDQLMVWENVGATVADGHVVDCDMQGGGMTGTALVAVTRLGGAAEFWGVVGDDWVGETIFEGLRAEGVEVGQAKRLDGERGPFTVVGVDQRTGEREFLYNTGWPDTDELLGSAERLAEMGCVLIDDIGVHKTAAWATEEAQRLGIPTVADFSARNFERTVSLLRHVDHALVSEEFAQALGCGDDLQGVCETVRSLGPSHAVITLGDRGLVSLSDEGFAELPGFDVEVVDTTGAGDVFHGAFCYGLVQRLDLEGNLRFASAAAALKCRRVGGRAGIPTEDEVNKFLEDRTG